MVFKNGVKNTQAAGYNGARTVLRRLILIVEKVVPFGKNEIFALKVICTSDPIRKSFGMARIALYLLAHPTLKLNLTQF